jgi:hypothetical protein
MPSATSRFEGSAMSRAFWLGVTAYVVPSFVIAYPWHLGLLSWSFTTLAVAAKNVMTSVPIYLALETGFTVLQFVIVGPLIALAHRS